MRPPFPLPPRDEGIRVPGILLLRTDGGSESDAWDDVLERMGELPGMRPPGAGGAAEAEAPIPRRLIVAEEPGWRGSARATPQEIAAAFDRPGAWIPDLVVLTDVRTARDAEARPLLAFSGSDGQAFWVTPRQTAMAYLALHRGLSFTFDGFAEEAPAEWEDGEEREPEEEDGDEPAGFALETRTDPPRYTPPARALPVLVQETDLLVRTDFGDDAAWASVVDRVRRGRGAASDVIEDFGEYVTFVDDPAFAGATPEQVMAQVRPGADLEAMISDTVLIADSATLREPGHPVRVVPLEDEVGHSFRVDAEVAGIMVVNLALGNMDLGDWREDDA
nr:hypothetical protein [Streptomyces parvus]